MFGRTGVFGIISAAVMAAVGSASANSITVTMSQTVGTNHLNAEADITLSGTTLDITLINKTSDQTQNGSLLTAFFWDSSVAVQGSLSSVALAPAVGWAGDPTSSPVGLSEVIPAGGDTGVFGYSTNVNDSSDTSRTYAVSTTGLGIQHFGTLVKLTGGPSPANSSSPDGPDGGLTGLGGYSGPKTPIKNAITFEITGVSSTFALSDLSDFEFWYGTGSGGDVGGETTHITTQTALPSAPLPASVWGGMSLLGMLAVRRAFRSRKHAY